MKGLLSKAFAAVLVSVVAGCGGGGADAPVVTPGAFPTTYLSKYQGTWFQQCSRPIQYGTNDFGPSAVRERIQISAPDASGRVSMALIEDFFDSTLVCYDYTSTPFASIQTSVPAQGTMLRVETLTVGAAKLAQDVLQVTEGGSSTVATGSGVTQVTVNGVAYWRITFSDGKFVDRPVVETAGAGEIALYLVTVNDVPGAELAINGDLAGSFAKH